MKKSKTILLTICILLLVGCNKNKTLKEKEPAIQNEQKNTVEKTEEKVEIKEKQINIALYKDNNKITNYNSPMTIYKDIVSLDCFLTDKDNVTGNNFKEQFNTYYNEYNDITEYRIGYKIKFETTKGIIEKYIYRPRDVESYFDYVQTYLYDDIHQDSSWYSHVTDSEYNENTMLTSIKLTASKDINEVISSIEVIAFIYNKDTINDKNEYIGNNKYSVTINKM